MESLLQCPKCGEIFKEYRTDISHQGIKIDHLVVSKLITCPSCGYKAEKEDREKQKTSEIITVDNESLKAFLNISTVLRGLIGPRKDQIKKSDYKEKDLFKEIDHPDKDLIKKISVLIDPSVIKREQIIDFLLSLDEIYRLLEGDGLKIIGSDYSEPNRKETRVHV